ncbi:MAG TPA: hypothetical protein VHQ86_00215 [Candidatus Saccharimonadia bacterium]|jgi:thiol:disulfide interchange protein|nr:hypothetical protein [Candidatus Saccharimonadia bacterium]
MVTPATGRILMASDVLYFITFATGMAVFWASGHVPSMLATAIHHHIPSWMSLVMTNGLFGLGMLALAVVVTRRLGKAAVVAAVMALVLGAVAAQVIVRLAAPHVTNNMSLGLLTFALYLVYGGIYVASLATGRRLAR